MKLRTEFCARVRSDAHLAKIFAVGILQDGFLMTDGFNRCVKLFTTQGHHLHTHQCKAIPGHLALMTDDNTGRTCVLTLPGEKRIDILEAASQRITAKCSIQTERPYHAITAVTSQMLAVGYSGEDGIDLLNMDGQRLRQLTTSVCPLYMALTPDGESLACSVGGNTIVAVAMKTGHVLFRQSVPQIRFLCGITADRGGSLLVTDANTHTVHLVTAGGGWSRQLWAVPDGRRRHDQLCALAVDNHGLCVCATDEGSVFVLEMLSSE